MNIEELLQYTTMNVAYANIISSDNLLLAFCKSECYMNCDDCHHAPDNFFGRNVNKKQFKKILKKEKDLSCVLFFDNPKDTSISKSIIEFAESIQFNGINICLFTNKDENDIPTELKKIVTCIKFGSY